MSRDQLLHFRDMLLDSRKEILARVKDLESRWQEMAEPVIELEEEAQRSMITLSYDRLDETGKATIEKIDLALNKIITGGGYGICEHCGDSISVERLEALPWARSCIDCARELERKNHALPPPAELIETAELPDEYQGLTNNQILTLINEQIEKDGNIDTEELRISIRNGVVYLEGTIPGEPEHQILMQIMTDVLGFTSIVDHLTLNEVVFEREDRTPGKEKPAPASTLEDRLFYDAENLDEDLFDAGDDKPYTPPENPLPQEEYERHKEFERHDRTI
jgi:DnaK suppressor protein